MTSTKNTILRMLDTEKLNMIPRWQFVLYTVLGVVGLLFSLFLLVFIVSLVIFILSTHGFIFLPLFGFGALIHGLVAIPKTLLLLSVLLIIIIEILSRKYAISFKKPLLVTIGGVTAFTLCSGYLISLTTLHPMVRNFGKDTRVELLRHAYDRPMVFENERGDTVLRGLVMATSSTSITLEMYDNKQAVVQIGEETVYGILPVLGDEIVVFGTISSGTLQAKDIRTPRKPFGEGKRRHEFARFATGTPNMANSSTSKQHRR